MTDPVTFVINRSGRIEVMLGIHTVAAIDKRGHQIHYRFYLPGLDGQRIVSSEQKARRLVLHMLADWFEAAGPLFAPMAETVAAQAELERSVA